LCALRQCVRQLMVSGLRSDFSHRVPLSEVAT